MKTIKFPSGVSRDSMPVIYIPTIDPECGGGVKTVMEFTTSTLYDEGYFPNLVYNSTNWSKGRTVNDLIRGNISTPVYEQMENGRRIIEIGRVLPESEALGYTLNMPEWNNQLDDSAPILGVGGTCLPCLPAAIYGHKFDCWIGTTLIDERRYQIKRWPKSHRLRYRIERPILKLMERHVLQSANNIYVQSKYTENMILDDYDVNRSKISKIPFPIDTDTFCPIDNNTFSKELIFVGRINDPRKRVDILLKGFAKLLKNCPDTQLHLVGGNPNSELRSLIDTLNIASNLEVHGRVEDILPLLRQASVFVLTSDQEGLGIAGLEAMSTGLPVVSTRSGGPEDYIEDGENGFLVPRRDPLALAGALEKLLESPALHQQMSSQARRTIQAEYQEEKVKSQLIDYII